MPNEEDLPLVLLTGATGYIGGRLLRVLEAQRRPVRCLARQPQFLSPRPVASTEVVPGDLLDEASVTAAMTGVKTAFYLVHSMGADQFEENDRKAATVFGRAAAAAGVSRIYLGGLGSDADLSAHLRSRQEVGAILRASGVPTIEFRASIVIGSGSLSFEMIRALSDRLPIMVTPSWVRVKAQPIAIDDVISYLTKALDLPETPSQVYEIGGTDRVSYQEIMNEYAHQRGLTRLMVPVPFLTPRLSSLWLGLVTPVYARVGRKLIDSIRHETVADTAAALATFDVRPMGLRAAVARALANEDRDFAETRWSDSLSAVGGRTDWSGSRFGSRLVDSRSASIRATAAQAFRVIEAAGGKKGWFYGNILWTARGLVDLIAGGPGLRRGRRNPQYLRTGDALDFWRVEAVEPPRLLRLLAEMKLPGRAWLQFEIQDTPGGVELRQTAIFDPVGVAGLAYWYGILPIHKLIFAGMLRNIVRTIEDGAGKGLP